MNENITKAREKYYQFLRKNAKAVSQWPEWMRLGAYAQSSVISPQQHKENIEKLKK